MNKKTIAILGTAVLVLSLASVSLAGPMGGGMGMSGGKGQGRGGMGMGPQGQPPAQLTEQQLADWKVWQEKHFQLRKEYIGNLVKSGSLTQAEADARIKQMESMQAFRAKNNLVAPGAMRNVKLTDEQKADMKKLFEQRLATRKAALAAAVKSGQITQAQADNQIQRMQDHFNYRLENGMGANKGGRGMGGGKGQGRGGAGGGAGGGCNRF
jgi:Spy/CpxP family protein refolding chaperone